MLNISEISTFSNDSFILLSISNDAFDTTLFFKSIQGCNERKLPLFLEVCRLSSAGQLTCMLNCC